MQNSNDNYALSDISLIKGMLCETKTDMSLLGKIFIMYGILNMVKQLSTLLLHKFVPSIGDYIFISAVISFIVYSITVGYIVFTLRGEHRRTNQPYVAFLTIFSICIIFLPILLLLVRIASGIFAAETSNDAAVLLNELQSFVGIVLFSLSILIISRYRVRFIMAAASIFNIFIYLLLLVLPGEIDFVIGAHSLVIVHSSLYYVVVLTAGYIALGIYAGRGKRNEAE